MKRKAAIIRGGVIGGGWDVAIFKVDLKAARKPGEALRNARAGSAGHRGRAVWI